VLAGLHYRSGLSDGLWHGKVLSHLQRAQRAAPPGRVLWQLWPEPCTPRHAR
jgi:hypothetical protein